MEIVLAQKGDRLDSICYKTYGTLEKEIFNKFLEANVHLLKKIELDSFDKVYLPKLEQEEQIVATKGKALW